MKILKIVSIIAIVIFLVMSLSSKDPMSLTCLIFTICIFGYAFYHEKAKKCDEYYEQVNELEKENKKLRTEISEIKNKFNSFDNIEKFPNLRQIKQPKILQEDDFNEDYISDYEYNMIFEKSASGEDYSQRLSKFDLVRVIKRVGALYQNHFGSDPRFPQLTDKKIMSYLVEVYFPYELKSYSDDEILELLNYHFKNFKE